jgi:aldose 1-epimerase
VIELSAGESRALIDPEAGGRLAQLTVDGLDLLVGRQESPTQWGCFPMAPWAGRIRNGRFSWDGTEHELPINKPPHAIHGVTYDRPWDVTASTDTTADLRIELDERWPLGGHVTQSFVLDHDRLHLRMEVHAGAVTMPASCGWHPWWKRQLDRGEPVELDFQAGMMWVKDDEGIPTGALVSPTPGPWDDCFTDMVQPPELRWKGALEVEIESHCTDWVIFTEPDHAVCVEPQTGPPDALNIDPAHAVPKGANATGHPVIASATFLWREI